MGVAAWLAQMTIFDVRSGTLDVAAVGERVQVAAPRRLRPDGGDQQDVDIPGLGNLWDNFLEECRWWKGVQLQVLPVLA